MLLFINSEDIQNRAAFLGSKVEGESFPLSIKMPCRFAIFSNGERKIGQIGQYLVFNSNTDIAISDQNPNAEIKPIESIEPVAEPITEIPLKPKRKAE